MIVVKLERDGQGPRKSDEQLMMDLRLHEQVLSCLDYVVEKAGEFYPGDILLDSLNACREDFNGKRKKLMAEITANGNGNSNMDRKA